MMGSFWSASSAWYRSGTVMMGVLRACRTLRQVGLIPSNGPRRIVLHRQLISQDPRPTSKPRETKEEMFASLYWD
jgi:hypothetical protein